MGGTIKDLREKGTCEKKSILEKVSSQPSTGGANRERKTRKRGWKDVAPFLEGQTNS